MTIYSYCRTSELEAGMDPDALEAILEPEMLSMQTYCLSQGWYMRASLHDENCNWGQEFHRREHGRQLLAMLQPGDVILVSKLERIVSSSQEAVRLIRKLREKQAQLHIVELGGDITDYALQVGFEKAARLFSALEKRKSTERIRNASASSYRQSTCT